VQCKECLLKVVDCHKQNRAVFNAAKALDQCVLVCKELGELQEIASLAERAANMFQSNGSAEKAASSLERAAKILESRYPEQALRLFQHASEIAMVVEVVLKGIVTDMFFFRSRTTRGRLPST
jgi:F0F1-type ATP synthase delta subunit